MSLRSAGGLAVAAFLSAAALPGSAGARKVGVVFNSGANLGEDGSGKDREMAREAEAFALFLRSRGYDLEGNVFSREGGGAVAGERARVAYAWDFLARLESLCESLNEGDTLALAFSGHGAYCAEDDCRANTQQVVAYRHARPRKPDEVDLKIYLPERARLVGAVMDISRDLVRLKREQMKGA